MATFPTLKPGDTVGIMSTASRADPEKVEDAVKTLESMGYKVRVHPQTFANYTLNGILTSAAGTPTEKVQAFEELWSDPNIKGIIVSRGGNESAEMLPLLDYKKIAATPKVLIGFSDITALTIAINKFTDIVTFHGPMLISFKGIDQGHLTQCFKMLSGHEKNIPLTGGQSLKSGSATGRLLGGNLSVLCSAMGTPQQPDFKNTLLFLEDVGEELSRVNRYLLQLKLAGVFNQISGLIIGGFNDLGDNGKLTFGRTVKDMVEHHTQGTSFPIVMNAPFGHDSALITLPVGAQATLSATHLPTLTLL